MNNCPTLWANDIKNSTTVPAAMALQTMAFLPNLSASMPQTGADNANISPAPDMTMPAQNAAEDSSAPSSDTKKGRKGKENENPSIDNNCPANAETKVFFQWVIK